MQKITEYFLLTGDKDQFSELGKLTNDAIKFMDKGNKFWTQQVPHQLLERTLVVKQDTAEDRPLSASVMITFLNKETKRIHGSKLKSLCY